MDQLVNVILFTFEMCVFLVYSLNIIYYLMVLFLTMFTSQVSHTSQMRKFKSISTVIKGSTTHFQWHFWKTVVTLLYENKISSNFSHLLQDVFWFMQFSKQISLIFLQNDWWQKSLKFIEKTFFSVFHKFYGDSRFLHKIPVHFQCSRNQNKFQAFKGFKEPWEPWLLQLLFSMILLYNDSLTYDWNIFRCMWCDIIQDQHENTEGE